MLRITSVFLLFVLAVIAQECKDEDAQCSIAMKFNQDTDWQSATSVYAFHANDIFGKNVQLEKYRGHVLIIVNVASNCGLTDTNYKQLQQLYNKFSEDKGLRILAFPSNQFAGQEPGTSEEIMNFVKQYNVTFDMFEKIDVNGENAHPLWKWLQTQKAGLITNAIKWNFTKFIVDKEGKVVERFAPSTEPINMEETLKKYF
ncbi:probable phospholipid hydroperoxide glutathione peroxidase [Pogonomyrmex barbatus]|uniref:Glutathione peroxidase n=1 Tax=Pogonomyrmex barbatus TaxID=144034 RepID=A0A6I9VZ54_9HYME|nr:probable phospholipid hydroperoxide glutathione peroxidase [Pogonomyrmex barbatus]XP_011634548.1 probable phospholipid hydroperoxide glutathione peroxidase [Pogonomyrmex barbatus]XP_011634549.1 probable phospholipid hydroperoxide glutathione peroxidase [Pogonomyrmex barbatus]